jgi:NAD(P)-dependent dehydrogenase (short-subunit alcohol dehydrogenase family)
MGGITVVDDTVMERKCLVTGGASGLGLAIAKALSREGARVAIGDVSATSLASAGATEPDLLGLELDVRRKSSVESAVESCVSEFGGLDVVVHAAGVIHVKPLVDVREDDWQLTLDVNLSGAFRVVQAAVGYLRQSRMGRIVFITSGAGARGYPWLQAYCASKFGLGGLAQSLAAELAADGITVNCVAPGACPFTGMGRMLTAWKAAMTDSSEEEVLEAVAIHSPFGRYAEESEIAAAVVFLVSDSAGYMTGTTLDVTGGEHLGVISGASSRSGSGFTRANRVEVSDV